MSVRKLKERLRSRFGSVPDWDYLSGDMDSIRTYYDYRRKTGRDKFLIDETTWTDLDLSRIFRRINPRRCTSGEQYLYYMLRSPAIDRDEYERRSDLIDFAAADEKRRLNIEVILARLGCTRRADIRRIFDPKEHGAGALIGYIALLFALIASAVCAAVAVKEAAIAAVIILAVNVFVHENGKRRCQLDFDTVNYTINMVFALRKLQKLRDPELDAHLSPVYPSLERLRPVLRVGGLAAPGDSAGFYELIASVTLIDLISYEYSKSKLGRCHEDVFAIHEYLGRLDAAISVASYRKSLSRYCLPELSFDPHAERVIRAAGLVHPLLNGAVPNDLILTSSMLITGSNASGKSTFLKSAALSAIMAQSICTVPARSYSACAFRVYTSMAVSDDILAGESYYIVEIRSLKRILDAAETGEPILCAVDEVLRGTNTVERIAASSEVLKALTDMGALCVAATHDIELCDLLGGTYMLSHFEERLGDNEMTFDYKLRPGKATSRNAINLLELMGFDEEIVESAHERANRYIESGKWQA